MEETLREIKKRFRMAMNGIVSTSMREKGMEYRINFGLTLPLIRNIAESYTPNAELAQYLWKEQIRESKMLATWLYPANEMNPDIAQQWAEEIPYPEIADICCMNLFIKLPFAIQKASEWVTSDKEILRYTGYQLFNRLMMQNRYPDKAAEENLISSVLNQDDREISSIRIAALNCIKRLMHRDLQTAEHTADIFRHIYETGNDKQKRFAEEIFLEYEFCKDTLFPTQDK
ncbi:DNA alkylation repair protein [uncultured Coprobacter sp.]|jgi:peptidase|uniref:DNA alkylation repair protein n=1 Tax=uncultured Coprobacter sp. TaxID=1720550 RepID=UPI0025E97253|nr:DNA alkylation repair protein [uncultured Coprobacter sp.]